MTSHAAVAMQAVSKRLGSRDVLRGLTFDVPRGGTLGILGPSGCGKTTALRLLAGLEVPDAGEIWLAQQRVSSPARLHVPPRRRNIGFVFQDLALWPHMTVEGMLLFVLKSRGSPAATRKARIDEMLDMVGMRERAGEYPGHLSGGEQQRIALARALVGAPDLLLLDEPLSSLDPGLRAGLRKEVAAIPRTLGVTMIYVTHDEADADAFGGAILRMSAPAA